MTDHDARITLPTLDRPTVLPHVDIEKSDALILGCGAGGGLLLAVYFQLGLFALPAILAGIGGGALVLVATPNHLSGPAYLCLLTRTLRTRDRVYDAAPDTAPGPDGLLGLLQDERTTRTSTHLERYLPDRDVIVRDDGQLVAALELDPQGMDFAEDDDWERLTTTLETLANDSLDFPLQLYVTTRSFPMEDYLATLESRLQDPDVQSNDTLEALLSDYVETRRADLERTTTAPPSVYAVVSVADDEALDQTVGETTGFQRLASLPLVGIPFGALVRSRAGIGEDERLDRMAAELDRRLGVLESGWVSAIDGVDSRRLSVADWLPLLEEFWTGGSPQPSDETTLRASPVVTAETESRPDTPPGSRRQSRPPVDDTVHHDSDTDGPHETLGRGDETAPSSSLSEIHQRQVAPAGVETGFETIDLDEECCQVMYVEGWPDTIELGALRSVFRRSDVEYDLSIHLRPIDRSRTLEATETRYRSLRGDAEIDDSGLSAREKLTAADETALFRRQVENGQTAFRVVVYVVARADDEASLQTVSRELRSRFCDPPANARLKTVKGEQLLGLESVAPVGRDVLSERGRTDTSAVFLGRGVGALLASIQDSGLVDPGGIEVGEHAYDGTPVIVDPFDTGINYNWTVVGDSGSGKTYFAAQTAVRTHLHDDDTKLVFVDPMQAFEGVARALDADTVRVGGQTTLNPLEIRPPAGGAGADPEVPVDPLRQKVQDVLSLFDNFAHQQGIDGGLGEARSLLSTAVVETYERAGITHDVTTHDRPSPTIEDLLDVLETVADHPEEYILRTERETETLSQYATRLLGLLRPFVDGEYSHLSGRSSLEFGDGDVVYMDMSEEEGRTGGGGGLTMQLVFSQAYELAKECRDRVVIVIDEARFFMRHSVNLDFLGQRVRHSRHFDTSIRFYTQNVNDFHGHDEAESILNNSAITVFHNTDEIDEWQDVFDLNDSEVAFVQSAATGTEGYSEALVDVDGRRVPLQVFATPLEDRLLDFDPRDSPIESLPGFGNDSPVDLEVDETEPDTVRDTSSPRDDTQRIRSSPIEWVVANEDSTLVEHWNALGDTARTHADLLTGDELATVLRTIRDTDTDTTPSAVLETALQTKIDSLAESGLVDGLDSLVSDSVTAANRDRPADPSPPVSTPSATVDRLRAAWDARVEAAADGPQPSDPPGDTGDGRTDDTATTTTERPSSGRPRLSWEDRSSRRWPRPSEGDETRASDAAADQPPSEDTAWPSDDGGDDGT